MFEFDGINKLYTFLLRVSRIPGLEFLRSDASRLAQSQMDFYEQFDEIEGGIEGGEDGLRAIGEAIGVTNPGHGNSHHGGGEQGGSPQHASGERPVVMKSTYSGESTSWSGKKTSGGAGSSRRAPKTSEELRAQKKLLMKKLRG
jgi:hypothetical protein